MRLEAASGFVFAIAAVAAPAPLHELAHLGPDVCPALLVHANAAIAGAVHDDAVIRIAESRLRAFELDRPETSNRRALLIDLERIAGDVNQRALEAQGELQRLRDDGSAGRPEKLHAFVEALAGALDRQRKVASDVAEFATSTETRDLRDASASGALDIYTPPPLAADRPGGVEPDGIATLRRPSAREQALAVASDLESRTNEIERDETRAAEQSEDAVTGCSQLPHQ